MRIRCSKSGSGCDPAEEKTGSASKRNAISLTGLKRKNEEILRMVLLLNTLR
ncbi:hypothetical protein NB640_00130 [Oxalobacter vibrioformis]|uniref:Uncharacterized protein n=1 Tax=Oxalobacter vibrioformis TaxID=933080 RepID=A0A9E9M250_9BURK|nr:hypothetical protein [Oxalobacter vibrioformis]WAW11373.1 hypothetical protein NB640_00130 [Oxalobacter vibrioformis]